MRRVEGIIIQIDSNILDNMSKNINFMKKDDNDYKQNLGGCHHLKNFLTKKRNQKPEKKIHKTK